MLPSGDLDAISWLTAEVVPDVVDDECLREVSVAPGEVLDVEESSIELDSVRIVPVEAI